MNNDTNGLVIPRCATIFPMPRGRTRDDDARTRVLQAAFDLAGDGDARGVTINQIAERAEVGKQTIYRWWPSKTAVILDALVESTMAATPFPDTGDTRDDFAAHLRAVIELFESPSGDVIRTLLGDAQTDPALAEEFRQRFWQPRRDLSFRRLERGITLGRVRSDLEIEVVLDTIYGPLWLRLLIGHLPMTGSDADEIMAAVWPGIAAG